MEIIELKNIRFKYHQDDSHYTLDDVSFHVKRGEWLSIVGHNGSGKSTTVRLIDGLLAAESGEIIIDGDLLTPENVWDKRRQIGMVFQNPDNQFVGATVEDDVAFGLENQGVSLKEMSERVSEALELVGMSDFKTREPARLSGGQKQRVAIAGIVALRPDIMILDEATSMLDPQGRRSVMEIVRRVKETYGMTVISITHDLDEVALSDRVLVMKSGKVVLETTPKALLVKSDLESYGLDTPFTEQLKQAFNESGFGLPVEYLTETELQETVWASISKM